MEIYNEHTALKTLGQRIKQLRVRKDLEQEELAVHIGLSRKTISNLENGQNVSLLNLFKILKSLGELHRLDDFLPETPILPTLLAKAKGKEKTMVRKNQRKPSEVKGEWQWSK